MASKPLVTCKYCGIKFDRDSEEWIKISTRYAHKKCYEKAQADKAALRMVTDLIQSLYYPAKPDWSLIGTQLKKYLNDGMTYMGMYYTLTYFFVIQKNDIHNSAGIGIIPYVYQKAKAYYKNVNNTYTKTAEVTSRDKIDVQQTEDVVIITQHKPNKKLLDFNYED